jgi:hypothetical protein
MASKAQEKPGWSLATARPLQDETLGQCPEDAQLPRYLKFAVELNQSVIMFIDAPRCLYKSRT